MSAEMDHQVLVHKGGLRRKMHLKPPVIAEAHIYAIDIKELLSRDGGHGDAQGLSPCTAP